jgi:glyoxylase-like metal-dependent hydrolase (beta-lactamase superfamily II)
MGSTFDVAGADGVTGIDLHLHDDATLSSFLVAPDDGAPVLVEPGHPNGYDRLREGLSEMGVSPADLAATVCSHVHLDHAGAAAQLAADAPDLDVYIHEMTAQHLVDPSSLVASSRDVMGEAFDDVGEPDALPEDRLAGVDDDGTALELGDDRRLELVPAPGHAPDALAAWDERTGTLFATETFGNYWPKADRWLPPATLPRFDVDAVRATLDRLRAFDPERVCLSHFGVAEAPEAAFDAAEATLDEFEARIPELYEDHDEDLGRTERAVEDELLGLDAYDDALAGMQRRVQTRGFLKHADRL